MSLIALFHPRRRHRHRWRNTWGKYLALPWVHRDQVGLCHLERHRCLVVQRGREDLWVRLGLVCRRVRVLLGYQRVLVVHLPRGVQHLRELVEWEWQGDRVVLSLHPCQVVRLGRWVLVGRVVQRRHLCLGFQDCRWGRVVQVRLVDRLGRLVPVGKACMVAE